MQIEIKAEDVEKIVRDELIKAGLGKLISEGITSALRGYDSPIDKALKQYMGEVAARLIRDHFAAQIEEAIAAAIRARVTPEIIEKVTDAAVSKMVRATDDRY